MNDVWYCSLCARPVTTVVDGLAGPLGYCRHSDADDAEAKHPAPVVRDVETARELIGRRLDKQALRRAMQKAHTEEGRASLSSREARVLAEYQRDK